LLAKTALLRSILIGQGSFSLEVLVFRYSNAGAISDRGVLELKIAGYCNVD
jgi:hypothetical protein